MPKVSVIMPSLNVKTYIEQCMETVLSQTLFDIEIICVDAGSVDGTLEILQKYAEMDSRVKLLSSVQRSYGAQVNMGIRVATSKYIAIVETDDYILPEMYERLFSVISEHPDLDFVKADWNEIIFSGQREYAYEIHMKEVGSPLYNREITVRDCPELFLYDVTVWRGLYRKAFLLDNHIWFQETVGAAYQDLGFSIEVLSYADKGFYIADNLYQYRLGRVGASSVNKNVVKYVWQECSAKWEKGFEHLCEKQKEYVYLRIAQAFYGEVKKLLPMIDFDITSEYLAPYYEWFSPRMKRLCEEGVIKKNEKVHWWDDFQLLISSISNFTEKEKAKVFVQKQKEECIKRVVQKKPVVIFGCGAYGKAAARLMLQCNVEVVAFCDNNTQKLGAMIMGVVIRSVLNCVEQYPDAIYWVANKNYAEEMKLQLSNLGILKEQIYIYI